MHATFIMNNMAVMQTADTGDQTGQETTERERKETTVKDTDGLKVSKPVCLRWCRFSWSDREKLWPQSVKSHWYGFSPGQRHGTGEGDAVLCWELAAGRLDGAEEGRC